MDMDFRPMTAEEVNQRKEMIDKIPRFLNIPDFLDNSEQLESIIEEYNQLRLHDYPEDLERIKFLYSKFKTLLIKLEIDYIEEHDFSKDKEYKDLLEQQEINNMEVEELTEIIHTEIEEIEDEIGEPISFDEELDVDLGIIEDESTDEIQMISSNGEVVEIKSDFEDSIVEDDDEKLSLEERINLALYGSPEIEDVKVK